MRNLIASVALTFVGCATPEKPYVNDVYNNNEDFYYETTKSSCSSRYNDHASREVCIQRAGYKLNKGYHDKVIQTLKSEYETYKYSDSDVDLIKAETLYLIGFLEEKCLVGRGLMEGDLCLDKAIASVLLQSERKLLEGNLPEVDRKELLFIYFYCLGYWLVTL